MAGATVRITDNAHQILRKISAAQQKPMQTVLDEALREYEAKVLLDDLNAYYAELRSDPQAWAEELKERAEWDGILADGLDAEEAWGGADRSASRA